MMTADNEMLMMIILTLIRKMGGRVVLSREEVQATADKLPFLNHSLQEDDTFFLEFKEPQ